MSAASLPSHGRRPAEPSCDIGPDGGATEERVANTCSSLQLPGEVVIVPTAWWHATCNLKSWTIGIGAQDSCGLDRRTDGVDGERRFHPMNKPGWLIACMRCPGAGQELDATYGVPGFCPPSMFRERAVS